MWKNRHAGSWLSWSPFQKNDIETVAKLMQVRPGDQPGYPKDTIESFRWAQLYGPSVPPCYKCQNERTQKFQEIEHQ